MKIIIGTLKFILEMLKFIFISLPIGICLLLFINILSLINVIKNKKG